MKPFLLSLGAIFVSLVCGNASSEAPTGFFKYGYKTQTCAQIDAVVLLHDGWTKKEWGAEDGMISFYLSNPQFEWDMICSDGTPATCDYERPPSTEDLLEISGYKYNNDEAISFAGNFPLYSSGTHGQIHIDQATNELTWSRLAPREEDALITLVSKFECEEVPKE